MKGIDFLCFTVKNGSLDPFSCSRATQAIFLRSWLFSIGWITINVTAHFCREQHFAKYPASAEDVGRSSGSHIHGVCLQLFVLDGCKASGSFTFPLIPPHSCIIPLFTLASPMAPHLMTETMPAPTPWLSVDEIAKHLGVSKDTVYNWINQRNMPAHKVGRFWKFQAPEVDAWIRSGGAADQMAEPVHTERGP